MSAALYFVSRKSAKEAERAEEHVCLLSNISAASAFSAPLRETLSALRAGASK
jgi:hypothetical protein